jgi:hypothetical protein
MFMVMTGTINLIEFPPTFQAAIIYAQSELWFQVFQLVMAWMVVGGFMILISPHSKYVGYYMLPLAAHSFSFIFVNFSLKGFLVYAALFLLPLMLMRPPHHDARNSTSS